MIKKSKFLLINLLNQSKKIEKKLLSKTIYVVEFKLFEINRYMINLAKLMKFFYIFLILINLNLLLVNCANIMDSNNNNNKNIILNKNSNINKNDPIFDILFEPKYKYKYDDDDDDTDKIDNKDDNMKPSQTILRRNVIASKLTFNKTKPMTKSVLNVNIYTLNKHRNTNSQSTITTIAKVGTNNNFNDYTINECSILNDLPDVKAYLSPTVLKATAIERIKFYQSNTSIIRSYSIIFKVERVFKLNKILVKTLEESNEMIRTFSMPLQKTNDPNQFGSYILVENFNLNINNNKSDCHSIDIKLNKNYLLYLNKNDISSSMQYFTHPMRLGGDDSPSYSSYSLSSSKQRKVDHRPKLVRYNKFSNDEPNAIKQQSNKLKLTNNFAFNRQQFNYKPNKPTASSIIVTLVKIPIYSISSKSLEITSSNLIEKMTDHILCHKCGKLFFDKKNLNLIKF